MDTDTKDDTLARKRLRRKEFLAEKLTLAAVLIVVSAIAVAGSVFAVFYEIYGDNMFKLIMPAQSKAERYAEDASDRGGIVFFGDSLTEFCDLDRFYPDLGAVNRGIAGDTTDGMLERIDSNVVALSPSVVVFLGGTNDLHHGSSPERIIENISRILSILTEKTSATVIVQSLYPVNPDTKPQYLNFVADRRNEDIAEVNAALPGLCEKYGCIFANVHPLLENASGLLREDFTADGLHVNAAAYETISDFLTPVIDGASAEVS